jgi:hypothetical protein
VPRRARPVLVSLGVVLLWPALAHGASPRVTGKLDAGPELAGARAAWAETSTARRGTVNRIRLAPAHGRPTTVQRTRDRHLFLFDASPAALAFDWASGRGAGRSGTRFDRDPRGGPLAGPYHPLVACGEPVYQEVAEELPSDLDGSLLLTPDSSDCLGSLLLQDLQAGTTVPLAVGSRVVRAPVAIAGRYVAFSELRADNYSFQWVTVFDRLAGREVYRTANLPLGFPGIDLQPDGTLAVTYVDDTRDRTFGTSRVDWYSIAEPRQHRLPYSLATTPVSIAGNRILVDRKRPHARTELALLGLGGARQSVARFANGGERGPRRAGSFDFDGSRVVFAQRKASYVRVRRHGRVRVRKRLGPITVELRRAP